MSYNKKTLAALLAKAVKNTTEDHTKVEGPASHSVLGGAGTQIELRSESGHSFVGRTADDGKPTLYILEDGVVAISEFIHECLQDHEIATRVGPKAIEKRLQSLIRELYVVSEPNRDWEAVVRKDVLQCLRGEMREWSVRAPITNLMIRSPFQIGRIAFESGQDGALSIESLVQNYWPENNTDQAARSREYLLNIARQIGTHATAWARATVIAHREQLSQVVRSELETAINTLRAFTHVYYGYDLHAGFGMPQDVTGGMVGFVAECHGEITLPLERRGVLAQFEVDEARLNDLRERFHFEMLCDIAGKEWDSMNSLERTGDSRGCALDWTIRHSANPCGGLHTLHNCN